MPTNNVLLVLVLRDAGLRSSLAARLGMSGADLLTVETFDDSRLARVRPRTMVLVADQAAVDSHEGGCDGLAADARWHVLVLVTDESSDCTPRVIRLPRKDAAAAITALIPNWQGRSQA